MRMKNDFHIKGWAPRFETEARGNSEMARWYDNDNDNGDDGDSDDVYGDGGVTTTMMMIINLQ